MEDKKKIIFIKWFPDDFITGCELLTWQTELVYSRIIQRIYNTRNNLYDEENTWNILIQKIEKYADIPKIKEELLKKDKIYIDDGKIKNKSCDKYLRETAEFQENASKRGKKGADGRWKDKNASSNASSNAQAMGNHKPQATNQQPVDSNQKSIFEQEFWDNIINKVGKEGARKSFDQIDFSKEKTTPYQLAEKYNKYFLNLPDGQKLKWIQGWLTERRWEEKEVLPPYDFAKKYNIKGRFIKYEKGIYHFEETEKFGRFIAKYDHEGNFVKDG